MGRDRSVEGGTGSRRKVLDAGLGWGRAQLSWCVGRHTADNVADDSSRLPSEGGWGVAAAEG